MKIYYQAGVFLVMILHGIVAASENLPNPHEFPEFWARTYLIESETSTDFFLTDRSLFLVNAKGPDIKGDMFEFILAERGYVDIWNGKSWVRIDDDSLSVQVSLITAVSVTPTDTSEFIINHIWSPPASKYVADSDSAPALSSRP